MYQFPENWLVYIHTSYIIHTLRKVNGVRTFVCKLRIKFEFSRNVQSSQCWNFVQLLKENIGNNHRSTNFEANFHVSLCLKWDPGNSFLYLAYFKFKQLKMLTLSYVLREISITDIVNQEFQLLCFSGCLSACRDIK